MLLDLPAPRTVSSKTLSSLQISQPQLFSDSNRKQAKISHIVSSVVLQGQLQTSQGCGHREVCI
jgi:hypothetical protein